MENQYNLRSPAVKRLMKEASELREPTELFYAQPLEDNLFEWHFSVRGPPDTEFEGGIYHGRIVLPPEYPMKPPSIILLTPNGRFELNKKICLSISGFHPESWQPSWSIRTALLAIIGFMPTHGAGAIGSLNYSPDERKMLAKKALDWKCSTCGVIMREALPEVTDASIAASQEAKELAQQISFKDETDRKSASDAGGDAQERANVNASTQPSVPEQPTEPVQSPSTQNENIPAQPNRPVPAPANPVDPGNNSAQLLMIVIIAIMIAALLFRRIWIMNDGHVSRSDL